MICLDADLKVLKVIIAVVLIFCSFDSVFGRKCVCTSKACKESGAKTCRTRFSCYTELIYSGEATAAATGVAIKTTRGCTEGATPLLCETKTWRSSSDEQQENSNSNSLEQVGRVAWPRLTCCDDRDYCNAADEDFETTSLRPDDRELNQETTSSKYPNRLYDYHSRTTVVNDNVKAQQNVQSLHVAALILAIAALISVFAACYVVTRFLNASSGANSGLPIRILNPYSRSGLDV